MLSCSSFPLCERRRAFFDKRLAQEVEGSALGEVRVVQCSQMHAAGACASRPAGGTGVLSVSLEVGEFLQPNL